MHNRPVIACKRFAQYSHHVNAGVFAWIGEQAFTGVSKLAVLAEDVMRELEQQLFIGFSPFVERECRPRSLEVDEVQGKLPLRQCIPQAVSLQKIGFAFTTGLFNLQHLPLLECYFAGVILDIQIFNIHISKRELIGPEQGACFPMVV